MTKIFKGFAPDLFQNFDFTRNTALNRAQVLDLVSGDFVLRGENLILFGAPVTGKTRIARAVYDSVNAAGGECIYIDAPGAELVDSHHMPLVQREPFSGRPRIMPDLLSAKLLIVEEADRWFELANSDFLYVIGRRAELGLSNVLIFSGRTVTLERIYSPQVKRAAGAIFSYDSPSPWASYLFDGADKSIAEVFQNLGIDVGESNFQCFTQLPIAKAANSSEANSPRQHNRSSSDNAGAQRNWHLVFTGSRSFAYPPVYSVH